MRILFALSLSLSRALSLSPPPPPPPPPPSLSFRPSVSASPSVCLFLSIKLPSDCCRKISVTLNGFSCCCFGTCKYRVQISKRNVLLSEIAVRMGQSSLIYYYRKNCKSQKSHSYILKNPRSSVIISLLTHGSDGILETKVG